MPLFVLLLQPARAASGSYLANLTMHFSFLAIAMIVAYFVCGILDESRKLPNSAKANSPYSTQVIWMCIAFSIIGLVLVYYDRVFVRGIDYSVSLRAARYQWRQTSGGNLAGVAGNILNSFGYVSMLYIVLAWGKLGKLIRIFLIFSVCSTVFGMGFLNAGRSNILIAITFGISLVLIYQPGSILRVFFRNAKKIFTIGFVGCLFIYTITLSSASMGSIALYQLYELGVLDLYGQLDWDATFENRPQSLIFLYYIVAYLFHGQWTSQIALTLPATEPFYVFGPIQAFLSYFGIVPPNKNIGFFSDTGAFISFPGALYYDFGIAGIVLGGLGMGILLGIAIWIVRKNGKGSGFLEIIFAVTIISHFLLSSFCIYYGFLAARVLPAPFIVLWLASKVNFRRHQNFGR